MTPVMVSRVFVIIRYGLRQKGFSYLVAPKGDCWSGSHMHPKTCACFLGPLFLNEAVRCTERTGLQSGFCPNLLNEERASPVPSLGYCFLSHQEAGLADLSLAHFVLLDAFPHSKTASG